jgi:hypothetical protein
MASTTLHLVDVSPKQCYFSHMFGRNILKIQKPLEVLIQANISSYFCPNISIPSRDPVPLGIDIRYEVDLIGLLA